MGNADPTVSESGMVILVLSLLVGIKLKFGQSPLEELKLDERARKCHTH